ncbi:MAG: deoxyribodipyrimidine photo-lyase [Myxococcales bacterium]
MTQASAAARLTQLLDGRVSAWNDAQVRDGGEFVLLWLQCQRRIAENLAAGHALRAANELGLPLVVYEGLRDDYPHASDRLHRFVLEGVAGTAADCAAAGLLYGFFLQAPGEPRGVLHRLAARAALVVTDALPTFIHPAQTRALASRASCRVEVVDNAGAVALAAFPRMEFAARTLRPKIQKKLPDGLQAMPRIAPRVRAPARFDWGFTPFVPRGASDLDAALARCALDRTVRPVAAAPGGRAAGLARLRAFIDGGLAGYAELRNQPSLSQVSWLSPYLHFGFVGAAEIARAVSGAAAPAEDREAFLEELIVRRELALNFCARVPAHATFDAAPAWAKATLRAHEADPRPALLDDAQLENAATPDPVWNAAQRQLAAEGRIHGYLRMLWGKSLLLWSRDAREAHRRMVWLNDKYALDGRDASSYTNFLWCLGLHDRPFPERAIFGTVRSMTSQSTQRKFDLKPYLSRWGISPAGAHRPGEAQLQLV